MVRGAVAASLGRDVADVRDERPTDGVDGSDAGDGMDEEAGEKGIVEEAGEEVAPGPGNAEDVGGTDYAKLKEVCKDAVKEEMTVALAALARHEDARHKEAARADAERADKIVAEFNVLADRLTGMVVAVAAEFNELRRVGGRVVDGTATAEEEDAWWTAAAAGATTAPAEGELAETGAAGVPTGMVGGGAEASIGETARRGGDIYAGGAAAPPTAHVGGVVRVIATPSLRLAQEGVVETLLPLLGAGKVLVRFGDGGLQKFDVEDLELLRGLPEGEALEAP